MLHLGDITKINGADVPAVNAIIGGSPCQDLSVAGKRAGLSGERSGLFMEQLRIIKEMRRKDIENGAVIPRPRYMVWENVTGAFSSNKGRDFKTVLEETIGVITEVKPDIPIECERLQGFPDNWTNIDDYIDTKGKKRKTSDSARYKALGNSIALPSWVWVLERLARCCRYDYTMASLFDGIGGFPLIWETLNGKGTCLWASEIDEFPIAVTKRRFS